MVNAEGDIKITDFAPPGLAAAAPFSRRGAAARQPHRVPRARVAANEVPSAATDVFALGVLAYELVTGHRTFRGETAQQIAQSVRACPPVEPLAAAPDRAGSCSAASRARRSSASPTRARCPPTRSTPRFAWRPSPAPGKDVGAQVKQAMDRIAALHEGEMSGVLAFNIGTGSARRAPEPGPPIGPSPVAVGHASDFSTDEMASSSASPGLAPRDALAAAAAGGPATIPTQPMMAAATVPDVPARVGPVSTVTGLPPMPVPVPRARDAERRAAGCPAPAPRPRWARARCSASRRTRSRRPGSPRRRREADASRVGAAPPTPRRGARRPRPRPAQPPGSGGLPRLPTPSPFSEEPGAAEPARPSGTAPAPREGRRRRSGLRFGPARRPGPPPGGRPGVRLALGARPARRAAAAARAPPAARGRRAALAPHHRRRLHLLDPRTCPRSRSPRSCSTPRSPRRRTPRSISRPGRTTARLAAAAMSASSATRCP